MAISQKGTWGIGSFKLPDIGATEFLGWGNVNPAVTAGGTALIPKTIDPTAGVGQKAFGVSGGNYNYSNARSMPGSVLGVSTSTTNPGLSNVNNTVNNQNQQTQQNQNNWMNESQNSELQTLNTQFDGLMGNYSAEEAAARREQDLALSGLETAQQGLLSQVDQQKQGVMNDQESAIAQAGDTARNAQRSNRNILRALGILNSSYAGDKLSETNNQFGTVRADIVKQATQRIAQLDDFANQKKSEYVNQVQSIRNQFATMLDNISRDIRQTDRSKADAVRAINAAYSQKVAELKSSTQSVLSQVEQAKQNFVASNFQNMLANNPELTSNIGSINDTISNLSNAAEQVYGNKQAALEAQKKRQLFPTGAIGSRPGGNYLYSGGLSSM